MSHVVKNGLFLVENYRLAENYIGVLWKQVASRFNRSKPYVNSRQFLSVNSKGISLCFKFAADAFY